MSLQQTPSGERIHIGFFGLCNAGKSSLVNIFTGQNLSIVSEICGTTTDPVKKAMELLPLGPVMIVDTPGFDDKGTLGKLRVEKAEEVLKTIHIALLTVDATKGLGKEDSDFIERFKKQGVPYLLVYSKCDLLKDTSDLKAEEHTVFVSSKTGMGIELLKEKVAHLLKDEKKERKIVSDLLSPGDTVILVMPIDEGAPKGRLILPQTQTIRELLDAHMTVLCCQDTELSATLSKLKTKPKLIITDSQAFKQVNEQTPKDVLLTSFSILFARYKGDLPTLIQGAAALSDLKDHDKVVIAEGCTHHRQCKDIGSTKIPAWIEQFTHQKPDYHFTQGGDFPKNLSDYRLIIHCGACMLTDKEMERRMALAKESGVRMVNYGIAIAHMHGILERSLELFPDLLKLL